MEKEEIKGNREKRKDMRNKMKFRKKRENVISIDRHGRSEKDRDSGQ